MPELGPYGSTRGAAGNSRPLTANAGPHELIHAHRARRPKPVTIADFPGMQGRSLARRDIGLNRPDISGGCLV